MLGGGSQCTLLLKHIYISISVHWQATAFTMWLYKLQMHLPPSPCTANHGNDSDVNHNRRALTKTCPWFTVHAEIIKHHHIIIIWYYRISPTSTLWTHSGGLHSFLVTNFKQDTSTLSLLTIQYFIHSLPSSIFDSSEKLLVMNTR